MAHSKLDNAFAIHNERRTINGLTPIVSDEAKRRLLTKHRWDAGIFIQNVRDKLDLTKIILPEKLRKARMKDRQAAKIAFASKSVVTKESRRKTTKSGWVYAITNPAYPGWIKIGSAIDVETRLKSYQTYSPEADYKLLDKVYSKDRRATEREIHESISHLRGNGEWFRLDEPSARKILEMR